MSRFVSSSWVNPGSFIIQFALCSSRTSSAVARWDANCTALSSNISRSSIKEFRSPVDMLMIIFKGSTKQPFIISATNVPSFLRTIIRFAARTFILSRIVERPTENCSDNSASVGSRSPGFFLDTISSNFSRTVSDKFTREFTAAIFIFLLSSAIISLFIPFFSYIVN